MKKLIAATFCNLGISADFLTVIGLLLAGCSGWSIYSGDLFAAAVFLLFSGLTDMLDGEVARLSGKANAFGGIFDSTLDRYGDAFVFSGLLFYFFLIGRDDLAALSASAWIGSFLISYVRARAECEIDSCRVGFWERGERIGVLVIALAADNAAMAVWILGIGTHWTALQRLCAAAHPERPFKTPTRSDAVYFLKIAVLAATLVFVRLP